MPAAQRGSGFLWAASAVMAMHADLYNAASPLATSRLMAKAVLATPHNAASPWASTVWHQVLTSHRRHYVTHSASRI